LIVAKTFSFSFLLILDEGGLREGWVKSAYSSLAATAGPQNHNNIFCGKSAANRRRIDGKTAPTRH
jgi:hypothetical protein